jgi:hypothetical protein
MSTSHAVLKFVRNTHLYLGIFLAPALLFFAFTGALQTFSLHETTQGSSYKPPAWIVTLGQIHKKQTSVVPGRKVKPDAAAAGAKGDRAPAGEGAQAKAKSHLPLKIFFLLVAFGLFTSTLSGIYMAYRFTRNKWVVTGLLVGGVVVPLFLLRF